MTFSPQIYDSLLGYISLANNIFDNLYIGTQSPSQSAHTQILLTFTSSHYFNEFAFFTFPDEPV